MRKYLYLILVFFINIISVDSSKAVASTFNSNVDDRIIAFVNVNVIPMDFERIISGQTVIIAKGKIRSIGDSKTVEIPKNALIINGKGKYLMPGFVDMHVHINNFDEDEGLLFIANGVTTVRNMTGDAGVLTKREQIDSGEMLGPTIYTSSPILDGSPPYHPEFSIQVDTPNEAEGIIGKLKADGYDCIKIYNNLSTEVYNAIIKAAAIYRLPVVGHVPWEVGIEGALEARQYSIEHLQGYPIGLSREAEQKELAKLTEQAGVWNCPTLVAYRKPNLDAEKKEFGLQLGYLPPDVRVWRKNSLSDDSETDLAPYEKMVGILKEYHCKIIVGTDSGDTGVAYVIPGFSFHNELGYLYDAGLTPYQVLEAATKNAAECLGKINEFGTVEVGKRADLILLNKNPLENMANTKEISGIMMRGKWYGKDLLTSLLDKLSEKYGNNK